MTLFVAILLVALFALWPALIGGLASASFPGAGVATVAACGVYMIYFAAVVAFTYQGIRED